jgi:hypothetical protein
MTANSFTALGLPERPDLTDEEVRAAWRAIAAATHPDRPDGGDVARYTAATAAYAQLRTAWGRSEAYADLTAGADDTSPLPPSSAPNPNPHRPPPPPACPGRPAPSGCCHRESGTAARSGWSFAPWPPRSSPWPCCT